MREPDHVGALIRDQWNRVYVQRRSPDRRLLPGAWDIVGGRVEPGEILAEALAREVAEETGWRLRRVEGVVADWPWEHDGQLHREVDYLIEVNGDLSAPRLEAGKHDKSAWVGFRDTDFIRDGYATGNIRLWEIISRASRIRLTRQLRLEPIGAADVPELVQFFRAGANTLAATESRHRDSLASLAADYGQRWEACLGYNWLAYERESVAGSGPALPVGWAGLDPAISSPDNWLTAHFAFGHDSTGAIATDMVRAALSFARNELAAEAVFVREPESAWVAKVLRDAGMSPGTDGRPGDGYRITFRDDFSHQLDQQEITGIGQILAVPRT